MPSQKGFSPVILIVGALVVGLLLLAAFSLGKYTQVQKPDVSASPEPSEIPYVMPEYGTYYHPSKGFTFEYPTNWNFKTEDGDIYAHSTDFYIRSEDYLKQEPENKIMNLTIIDSPLGIVRSNYSQAEEISVNSKTGLREGGKVLIPLGSSDSSVALLTFEDQAYIDHVISSFKFSEQSKIDDPQHWPVYEDKVNGFSFPYPNIFRVEPNEKGVKVFYDHPSAAGLEPFAPPKLALEVIVTKTSEIADVFADRVVKERMKAFGLSDSPYGITSDQLDFIPMYKTFVGPKDTPWRSVGYYFVNLNNSVIEIQAYSPNTETLKLNNLNIVDYLVYKFKFKK